MITSLLQGGLGNQLFQISAACAVAWDNNDRAIFDFNSSTCPLQGRVATNYIDNVYQKLQNRSGLFVRNSHRENGQDYSKIPYEESMILIGYFQSEKYFAHHRDKILELFRPSSQINDYIETKYGDILSEGVTSIHVRHGDYEKYKDTHPPCQMDYYEKAMAEFPLDTKYLIITDTPDWCKKNFKGENFYFTDCNFENDYIDFYIMSKCENNIIGNSSFSWWAAWLNENKNKKVVAPKKWFGEKVNYSTKDLYAEGWTIV
mgnify:CR=1 FL=1